MRLLDIIAWTLPAVGAATASSPSTAGIEGFVQRRLPQHVNSFEFSIDEAAQGLGAATNETYTVSSIGNGRVKIHGSTTSAVMMG
jgi:alpha-N-acetylglucosaminidase